MGTSALSSLAITDIKYEFDVFLNYHVTDRDNVAKLAQKLKDAGLEVWWDEWSIPLGANWMMEMANGIRKSCTTTSFLGPGAVGYWQREEYQLALSIQKKRNNLIIPVLLPGSSVDAVPDFLSLRNAADFTGGLENEVVFHKLVTAIRDARPAAHPVPTTTRPPGPGAPAPPDAEGPIQDLVSSLASTNITFFIGSDTLAASAPPQSRECDIAFRLLSDVELLSIMPPMLPPADIAALYYAMCRRDAGLEQIVVKLVQAREFFSPGLHDRLARLLPRMMSFPRMRGRKPQRQLIVSASLDTLMERALVQNRVPFVRIVVRRDQSTFHVNDYRAMTFNADGSLKYPPGCPENVDDFIQSFGHRDVRGEDTLEFLGSDELLTPIVFKVRGSYDVPDSCAISSVHFFEIARSLALESQLLDRIGSIVKHTPIVFLGMGFLAPEFRFSVQTLLRNELTSAQPRYLFQTAPDAASDDCFRRLEAGVWRHLKTRAQERNVTIVEQAGEELLRSLAESVEGSSP